MAHYPLNHHLRQAYRALAGAAGLYLALAGIFGIAASWGNDFLGRGGGEWVLGVRTNPGGAVLTTLIGAAILAAAALGGNLHHRVNLVLSWAVIAIATIMLALLRTDANILDFSMVTVIVWIVLGLVVLTAALYGKVGSEKNQRTEAKAALG